MAQPGPRTGITIPGYRCRKALPQDIPLINEIGEEAHFETGLDILRIYYETSPHTWFVVENSDNGKIVAYDVCNDLKNSIYMGYQLFVHSSARGKGVTRLFNTMKYSRFDFLCNQTPDSIERYPCPVYGRKFVSYFGGLNKLRPFLEQNQSPPIPDFIIVDFDSRLFDKLCAYDRQVVNLDRSAFLRKWSQGDAARREVTRIALDCYGEVVGYGSLKNCDTYHQIIPLYANSDVIADRLFTSLMSVLDRSDLGSIYTLSENRLAIKWAHELEWIIITKNKHRTGTARAVDTVDRAVEWKKVYATHKFWPA